MNVTPGQRQKGDKISLYLDYYLNDKRKYEYLKMKLLPTPKKGTLTMYLFVDRFRNAHLVVYLVYPGARLRLFGWKGDL